MKRVEIIGQRFGILTVLELAPSEGPRTMWKCRCDCGVIKSIASQPLRNGNTKSCGCLRGLTKEIGEPSEKEIQSFNSKYAVVESGCWEWSAGRVADGYGRMCVDGHKEVRATRFAYRLFYGVDPGNQMVCHTCDNPPCVNPAHLFLGSGAKNMEDKYQKGRGNIPIGSARPAAKMTEAQVIQMRLDRANGDSLDVLAKRYGLTDGTVHCIVNRKTWKHV